MTGGGGLVGTDLRRHLIKSGHEIISLERNQLERGDGARSVYCDLRQGIVSIPDNLGAIDAVIHNAACISAGSTAAETQLLYKVNVAASKDLLNWSIAQGVSKFIFTSSLSQLAKPLPTLITEDASVYPVTYYAQTKKMFEDELTMAAKEGKIQSVILRISSPISIMAENLPKNIIGKWINLARAGRPLTIFGSGNRTQDFVCTLDIADAVEKMLFLNQSDVFNICSGQPVSMLEIAKLICAYFENGIEFEGDDQLEDERWTISIQKAIDKINYAPKWDGIKALKALLGAFPR